MTHVPLEGASSAWYLSASVYSGIVTIRAGEAQIVSTPSAITLDVQYCSIRQRSSQKNIDTIAWQL